MAWIEDRHFDRSTRHRRHRQRYENLHRLGPTSAVGSGARGAVDAGAAPRRCALRDPVAQPDGRAEACSRRTRWPRRPARSPGEHAARLCARHRSARARGRAHALRARSAGAGLPRTARLDAVDAGPGFEEPAMAPLRYGAAVARAPSLAAWRLRVAARAGLQRARPDALAWFAEGAGAGSPRASTRVGQMASGGHRPNRLRREAAYTCMSRPARRARAGPLLGRQRGPPPLGEPDRAARRAPLPRALEVAANARLRGGGGPEGPSPRSNPALEGAVAPAGAGSGPSTAGLGRSWYHAEEAGRCHEAGFAGGERDARWPTAAAGVAAANCARQRVG
jgi:hypothetical protein